MRFRSTVLVLAPLSLAGCAWEPDGGVYALSRPIPAAGEYCTARTSGAGAARAHVTLDGPGVRWVTVEFQHDGAWVRPQPAQAKVDDRGRLTFTLRGELGASGVLGRGHPKYGDALFLELQPNPTPQSTWRLTSQACGLAG